MKGKLKGGGFTQITVIDQHGTKREYTKLPVVEFRIATEIEKNITRQNEDTNLLQQEYNDSLGHHGEVPEI